MRPLPLVIVAFAIVGVVFLVREVSSRTQAPPPQLIQCADGSVRTSCDGVVLPNPPPGEANTSRQSDDAVHVVDTEPSDRGSFEEVSTGPLSLFDGELIPIPGTRTLRVKAGDAAVIQAYQIGTNQMCEVAGVIGPASVSVTDGEAYYFAGVNASEGDLRDAMAAAAQAQQDDPQAHCSDSHLFVIR